MGDDWRPASVTAHDPSYSTAWREMRGLWSELNETLATMATVAGPSLVHAEAVRKLALCAAVYGTEFARACLVLGERAGEVAAVLADVENAKGKGKERV